MNPLWPKIGLGALAVFGTGMVALSATHSAASAARSAWSEAVQGVATIHSRNELPFRLDGRSIGKIRDLRVERATTGALVHVSLNVDLDPGFDGSLEQCVLIAGDEQDFDFDRGFHCGLPGTPGYLTIGEVRFAPGGFTRLILTDRHREAELRQGDPFQATAEQDGRVRVSARGTRGGVVQVQADSSGARIHVTDAMGRALLRLLADSTGASLRVRGTDGRDIVRLEAGRDGFLLNIDTTAASTGY
jgi:hypothetical protein